MNQTLNKVTLIGFLGNKFKIHYFEQKKSVARGDLATHDIHFNAQNEKITHTQWHQLVCTNDWAIWADKYLEKGDKLYVEGRIYTKHWQNEQGVHLQSTEIMVEKIIPLERTQPNVVNEQNTRNEQIKNFDVKKSIENHDEEKAPF
ncbi:single-stranded DNA-binding protein [Capnocytophaga sp. ARDL2]|uniref:single-stranded DNA-binding protein n=1 Tax=Capnocytophaga sp. ARDL2 TaxID=3238809 RepID=UPI003558D5FD